MNAAKPWLVLFDIDDTLVKRMKGYSVGMDRWKKAMQKVFDVVIDATPHEYYKGWVDYQIGWDLVKGFGVSLTEFEAKFSDIREALYQEALIQTKERGLLYEVIPASAQLATWLNEKEQIHVGLLTGNLEKVGWWKLDQAGIRSLFSFGLFSDTVKDRQSIAFLAIPKAKQQFGIDFTPDQVTVIGDTIYDIRCGKAIGAHTIGYTSGIEGAEKIFADEHPDIVARSLMEKTVQDWFTV
jgi:phosphoglycolate phosphatase